VSSHDTRRHLWWIAGCALLLLIVNIAIVAPLFFVYYSAYNGSIEFTFIAIARIMAEHPGQWYWWPYWNGGMPFENAYLPLLQWIVAAFTVVSGTSAAQAFHIVTAFFYALGPVTVFWMAVTLSRRLFTSFVGALAYSCLSLSPILFSDIRNDIGGALNLRRLHVLAFYGESPHIFSLTLLPVAIIAFHRALNSEGIRWKILAGVSAAAIALSNAFGGVMFVIGLICYLMVYRPRPAGRTLLRLSAIGVLSYCWVSPWLSPSFLEATRNSAMSAGGDYHYTATSWAALASVIVGLGLLWLILHKSRAPAYLQFFSLFAFVTAAIVVPWFAWQISVFPQPHRYHPELDLFLLLALVFSVAALGDRLPRPAATVITVAVITCLTVQSIHSIRYGRSLIRAVDPSTLSEYKIAQWMDRNRPGKKAFISGSTSFIYNDFTDNPQLVGGHEQHSSNPFLLAVLFSLYTGTNAGDRDADYSIFWMKAFGASAVSMSGEDSTEYYHPFTHPDKFDGVLPLLWRDGDDRIYEVPLRSDSLAHVMPAEAIPSRTPIHALDIEPVEPYVAALDNPEYPPATFEWKSMSEAEIHATLDPGQVVAVQITYHPGWEARVDGATQPVRGDAIGQMVVEPDCTGPCDINLRFTGGGERILTRTLSAFAMLFTLGLALFSRRRSRRSPTAAPHHS